MPATGLQNDLHHRFRIKIIEFDRVANRSTHQHIQSHFLEVLKILFIVRPGTHAGNVMHALTVLF